ncbi:hypothetical protein [Zestomonas carbonaria]|uniref:Lipoprotein n=1 Tax=Zestomonas carbonaria TaxID=2762745 RepID=A0A7U7I9W2_9GAMM|nr:hypothetical protein [Pseudomonas carbonaria]CAD5108596.1 hypothetical protein PSEWESI4_02888 [Pseudomonas carbonaria]
MSLATRSLLALTLALAGCSTSTPLQPRASEELSSLLRQERLRLELAPAERPLLRSATSMDGAQMTQDGQQVAQSLSSMNQGVVNAGSTDAGAAAVGIVLGSLLVTQLKRSGVEEKRQTEADLAIAELIGLLEAPPRQDWLAPSYAQALAEAGRAPSDSAALTLRVAPQLVLSRDRRSVRLINEIKLLHGRGSLYEGRIEVHGAALACTDECLQMWAADDGTALRRATDELVRESVRVLLLDWQTENFRGLAGEERTLRYQVGEERFVERGRLLALDSPSPLFLNLRGWVKSVPAPLEP